MKLWSIYRKGVFVGQLRAKTAEQAIKEYAAWARCPVDELTAS